MPRVLAASSTARSHDTASLQWRRAVTSASTPPLARLIQVSYLFFYSTTSSTQRSVTSTSTQSLARHIKVSYANTNFGPNFIQITSLLLNCLKKSSSKILNYYRHTLAQKKIQIKKKIRVSLVTPDIRPSLDISVQNTSSAVG